MAPLSSSSGSERSYNGGRSGSDSDNGDDSGIDNDYANDSDNDNKSENLLRDPLSASTTAFKQSRYFEFIKNNSTISLARSEDEEDDTEDVDTRLTQLRKPLSLSVDTSVQAPSTIGSVHASPLLNRNAPLPKTPLQQQRSQFFSPDLNSNSTSNSASTTPSPNRRFLKSRLNNVENRNYSYSSPTNDRPNAMMSFFNQPMLSPIDTTINYSSTPTLFESPSSIISKNLPSSSPIISSPSRSKNTLVSLHSPSKPPLSLEMKIIVNSRAESNTHDLSTFSNQSYPEFWNLTADEGKAYKAWNKDEFEVQSLLFEIFTNLRKIKFNLHRLLFIYGEELKDNGVINDAFYEKTFTVLHELYGFLDKLLTKKLKPLFDNHFFVNDTQVLKVLNKWFEQLNEQYRYISGSVVFLAKLSANEEVKKFILGISKKDSENNTNRSAVSPIELFSSYFIKLFTSVQLLFGRLKSIYRDTKNTKSLEFATRLEDLTRKINNISDSTSELDKKIRFNEKLSYRTEIDFSHMEMVDIFGEERRSREPLFIEMKTAHSPTWSQALLAPFDNYLLILTVKNFRREEYVLAKTPIPLQFLTFDTTVTQDNTYKHLHIKDINLKTKYTFRKPNDFTVAILDKFCKDLKTSQEEFWNNGTVNKEIDLKFITTHNFVSAYVNNGVYDLKNTIPAAHNLIDVTLERNIDKGFLQRTTNQGDNDGEYLDSIAENDVSPILTNVLSVDYFTYKTNQYIDRVCIIGTNVGIFIGIANDYSSFHQVHQLKNVRKLVVLNNDVIICIAGESLYRLSVEKLYSTYRFKLPACDINVFEENKRFIADFTIGYQNVNSSNNGGRPYLFAWKEKLVHYTELSKHGNYQFKWNNFKTHYNIVKLQTVYANNFGVAHIVDGVATWNLSKLSDIRSIALNNLDVKDALKGGEVPVAIFPFPNKTFGVSEVLVVYSRFCTRLKNVKGKYVQSSDEVTWFALKCHSASFDCEEKVLIVVGEQNVEIRQMYDDPKGKSTLIGCLVGNEMRLVNELPGKPIVKCHSLRNATGSISDSEAYQSQVVFRIKKRKRT